MITGRAEDRLTFDLQLETATRMHFTGRAGRSGVERFMRYYFLNAKTVRDLTAVFLAHLADKMAERGRRYIPRFLRRTNKIDGFVLDRRRLAPPNDTFLQADPVRLMAIFPPA